jgi:hypothetical protein
MARPMSRAEWVAAMKKWDVPVKWYPGWDTRGRPGEFSNINGVMIHHTGSDSQSDNYLDFLFVTGRPADGIPGPLCHVSTDMDGDLWVGATGRANHAGRGSSATLSEVVTESYKGYQPPELEPGPDNTDGNAHFYGNEVRFDGGQPMTAKQWNAAVLWAAAICDHYGWSARAVIGHREWTDRKPDPGNTKMYVFRAAVNAQLTAGPPGTTKPPSSGGVMAFDAGEITQIRAAVQAENEEYATRFWVDPTGTGTKLLQTVNALAAAAAEEVWDEPIPDVQTPESGDTAAARTHLTWMPKRVADQIMSALQPQLDDIRQRLERIEDDTDDGTA